MADSVINVASKSIKLIDNGDGTYSLASGVTEKGSVHGVVTSGTVTTLKDATKNLPTDIVKDKLIRIIIGGIEYIREITANTADTFTFADLVAKVAATAVIEKSGAGKVTITAVPEGVYANDYEVVVVDGVGANADTEAAFADDTLTITLGTDAGTAAAASIGTGIDGVITITANDAGVLEGYSIEVTPTTTPSSPMVAGFGAQTKKISVTLGTDEAGDLDATKNTALLIAQAINAITLINGLFTAAASGNGSGVFSTEITATPIEGGVDPVVDATAADVAAAVDDLTEFSAVVDSAGLMEALEDPVAFTGGVDEVTPIAGGEYYVLDNNAAVVSLSGSNTYAWFTATITLGTGAAHAAGDVVTTDAGEILEFDLVDLIPAGGSGIIMDSYVFINQNAVFSGGAGYNLELFQESPVVQATNAVLSILATEKPFGPITISTLAVKGATARAADTGHNKGFKLSSGDTKLYTKLVANGAETTITGKVITVMLGIAAL